MNETLSDLAAALRERLVIISDETSRHDSSQHMTRLQENSERIEKIENRLPPGLDPQLRHFLQRRSYGKALEHLTASESDATRGMSS